MELLISQLEVVVAESPLREVVSIAEVTRAALVR
jgi:hypothetical protein